MKKKNAIARWILLFFACVFAGNGVCDPSAEKPNVVLFFIDDLGYGDIEPYGSVNNKTPHLNQMAKEGVLFTDFYLASTQCSPSRAALLTGCYAERVGMDGVCFPDRDYALNPDEYTLAEMFRDAGYATGCFGKWHLGHLPGFLPQDQGFDQYVGIPYSNDMWTGSKNKYPPLPLIVGEEPVAVVRDATDQSLLAKVFTDAALDFIRENKEKSFFCYIPHAFVHNPRFAQTAFTTKDDPFNQRVLSAQVEELDQDVGQTLALLKELGMDEKTLVIFMSDNGGAHGNDSGPLRGGKPSAKYEGHMRTVFIARWPGKIPDGTVCREIGVSFDLYPMFTRLAGGRLPDNRIDGKDISSLLFSPEQAKPLHSIVQYGRGGLRDGNWKIVYRNKDENGKKIHDPVWELYDLSVDPGETNNLAGQFPDRVEQMRARISGWNGEMKADARPAGKMSPVHPLVEFDTTLPSLATWMKERR